MKRNKREKKYWESKDNKSFLEKSHLRRLMLEKVDTPVILETHGGRGDLFRRCYAGVETGIVFETDALKAEVLVRQRPNWAVYESAESAHLEVNFIDADPYGQAWQALHAFFESGPRADKVVLVVHDGMRRNLKWYGVHKEIFPIGS